MTTTTADLIRHLTTIVDHHTGRVNDQVAYAFAVEGLSNMAEDGRPLAMLLEEMATWFDDPQYAQRYLGVHQFFWDDLIFTRAGLDALPLGSTVIALEPADLAPEHPRFHRLPATKVMGSYTAVWVTPGDQHPYSCADMMPADGHALYLVLHRCPA